MVNNLIYYQQPNPPCIPVQGAFSGKYQACKERTCRNPLFYEGYEPVLFVFSGICSDASENTAKVSFANSLDGLLVTVCKPSHRSTLETFAVCVGTEHATSSLCPVYPKKLIESQPPPERSEEAISIQLLRWLYLRILAI